MRSLVLLATFLAGACAPGIVSADIPSPVNSTVPAYINLVGTLAGVPDPTGEILIIVRDQVNNPLGGSTVELNFANCSDSKLSRILQPGVQLDCPSKTLRAVTDAAGRLRIIALGASNISSPPVPPAIAPGAGAGCVRVYADGIFLGAMTVVIPDLNGGDGVNGIDYEVLVQEVAAAAGGAVYKGRDDLDHNGAINAADLSTFLFLFLGADGGRSIDLQATPYGLGFCP